MKDRQKMLVALLATWKMAQIHARRTGEDMPVANVLYLAENTCDGLYAALATECSDDEIIEEVQRAMMTMVEDEQKM